MDRLTLCNWAVDETVEEQKESHRLREAPFCPNCVTRLLDRIRSSTPFVLDDYAIVWSATGDDRHFAPVVQT